MTQGQAGRSLKVRFLGLHAGDAAFACLFAALALAVLFTFRDYGLSHDEYYHNILMGEAAIRFYLTLGRDTTVTQTSNLGMYGSFFDAPAMALVKLLPFHLADSHHLVIAFTGLLGLLGCRCTARLVGGPWAGFWSALFLASCAPYYGHIFINPKDVPFAAAWIWALYALLRLMKDWPRPALRDKIVFGLALGAVMGIRVGGVALVFLILPLLAVDFTGKQWRTGETARNAARTKEIAVSLLPSLAIAYTVMLLAWPSALLRPIGAPLEALAAFKNFNYNFLFLWNGFYVASLELPRAYLPVMLGVELPEYLVLLGAAAIPWSMGKVAATMWRDQNQDALAFAALLLATLALPLYAIATRATLYDNSRHFIFAIPPFACLCGIAWAGLLTRIRKHHKAAAASGATVVVLLVLTMFARMTLLHPYEYAFKNLFAGGMPSAEEKFSTDYWKTSTREAAGKVVAHARRVAAAEGIPFEKRNFRVGVNNTPMNVGLFLPDNFHTVDYVPPEYFTLSYGDPTPDYIASVYFDDRPDLDYAIMTTNLHLDKMSPNWAVIATVGRCGMTFSVVKARPSIAQIP